MGRSVLTNQFVSGLQTELKSRLAGKEGGFEQMLTLARFEEAKIRDLHTSGHHGGASGTSKKSGGGTTRTPAGTSEPTQTSDSHVSQGSPTFRCYECGKRGHRARECPDRKRREKETPGRSEKTSHNERKKPVSAISQAPDEDREHRIKELRRQLQEAELDMALRKQSATMHGVTPDDAKATPVSLGPTVYADAEIEGFHIRALVDTGSPATIVSLNCLLSALAKGRPKNQTPHEWELAVKQRLKPPEITLRSYGGGGLDIVGQLSATIQSGPYRKTAVVLVQNQAPEDLLLGTDLQPYLGFQLLQKGTGEPAMELLPDPEGDTLTRGNSRPDKQDNQEPSPPVCSSPPSRKAASSSCSHCTSLRGSTELC